jgi:hypothetical protein
MARHLLESLRSTDLDQGLDPEWLSEIAERLQKFDQDPGRAAAWETVEQRLVAQREARRRASA